MAHYLPLTHSLDLNNDTRNEYVDFGAFAEVNFERTDSFSGSIWHNSFDTSTNYVFAKRELGPLQGWFMTVTSTALTLALTDSFSTINRFWNHGGLLTSGAWNLLGWSYDGSNGPGGIALYVNGSSVTSGTTGSSLSATMQSTAALRVGSDGHFSANRAIAKLCHSALWDVELSAGEHVDVFGYGNPVDLSLLSTGSDLVHYCTLGNGCAIGAGNCPDLSTLGNDGTTVNVEAGDFVEDVPQGTDHPQARVPASAMAPTRRNAHGGGGDTTPPVVTLVSPADGSELAPNTPVVLTVTDDAGLRRVFLMVDYGGAALVVHDGERFRVGFTDSERTEIAGGYRYTLRRLGGWRYRAVFDAIAIDTSGNEDV